MAYGRASPGSDERELRLRSLNRSLTCLGDLARYRELHNNSKTKDWTAAREYYERAVALLPSCGHPHSQLAVLATYARAECVSVYHYCRSLLVEPGHCNSTRQHSISSAPIK